MAVAGFFGKCQIVYFLFFSSSACPYFFSFSVSVCRATGHASLASPPLFLCPQKLLFGYFGHMWTVDGKINFPHSHNDGRRWETGALLLSTAELGDAAVNHLKKT